MIILFTIIHKTNTFVSKFINTNYQITKVIIIYQVNYLYSYNFMNTLQVQIVIVR